MEFPGENSKAASKTQFGVRGETMKRKEKVRFLVEWKAAREKAEEVRRKNKTKKIKKEKQG